MVVFRNATFFLLMSDLFVAEDSPWVVARLVVLRMRRLLQEKGLTLRPVGPLAHMHVLCGCACVDLCRHICDLL